MAAAASSLSRHADCLVKSASVFKIDASGHPQLRLHGGAENLSSVPALHAKTPRLVESKCAP